jgi:hypothetical protein
MKENKQEEIFKLEAKLELALSRQKDSFYMYIIETIFHKNFCIVLEIRSKLQKKITCPKERSTSSGNIFCFD